MDELLRIRVQVPIMAMAFIVIAACDSTQPRQAVSGGTVPVEVQAGEVKFNANCAVCHGQQGVGTSQGPPLVHKIYEPNHHADAAFQRAAENGVKAHHWEFGNMPKIDAVSPAEVDQITQYVRWLQRQAGIF